MELFQAQNLVVSNNINITLIWEDEKDYLKNKSHKKVY